MSKVIQNIKLNLKTLKSRKRLSFPESTQFLNSLLHRGRKSKDPYNNRLDLNFTRLLLKTLGTGKILNPRCSNNFVKYINNNKNIRIAGFSSVFILLILSALSIYPIVKNLNIAEAATAQDSTTTLNINTGSSASVSLLVQDSAGTFAKSTDSQLANFSVTTNNGSGYNLIIKGKDSNYNKLSSSSTSVTLNSISSTMSESSFQSYTLSSNQGVFGYRPSKLNSSANSSYKAAPTTTGDTIEKTSGANSTANSYTIGLGVKANYNTPAGTYTNTYVITATGNGTPYSITYSDNTGDTISDLPSRQYSTEGITATSVTLSSATPTRSGYTFLRWCEGTVSNNGTTCSGTTYNSGASFGINRQATSNSTTLYAVWSPTITIKAVDGATMSLNGTSCSSTSSCTITGLEYNKSYNLVATVTNTDKYSFGSWSRSSTTNTGSITSNTSASTKYTVGSAPVTINPALTVNKYTCTKTYQLQNADGNYTTAVSGGTEQVEYGTTCTYTKTLNSSDTSDYSYYNNGSSKTGTCTMTASGCTVNLQFPRNTYALTVNKDSYISSVTGAGTYRWGQSVSISATASSGNEFVNWTQPSGTTGSFGSTTSTSTTFTMGKGAATIQANGKSSVGSLQNYSIAECSALNTGSTIQLRDNRDNQIYTVAKLADGNCWMDNLNLGAVELVNSLTSSNTNFDSTISISDWNSYKVKSSSGTYTTAEYIPVSGTDSTSGTIYGTLYNYCAASAGMYCYESTANGGSRNTSDICPKGWSLPAKSNGGEFQFLYENSNYNTSAKMRASITNGGATFALAGNSTTSPGTYGYYWTAGRIGSDYKLMDILQLSKTTVSVNYGGNRNNELSVRCVLKSPLDSVADMQSVTASTVSTTADGRSTTLTDSRDGQQYGVIKINGILWMTKNLAIGCNGSVVKSITLNSSTSNVLSSYTTPSSSGHSNTNTEGKIVCSAGSYGAWYNYYAATAGTIQGSSDTVSATYSICPKGWRLPTSSELSDITSDYRYAFNPVNGGNYYGGTTSANRYGYWWSATAKSGTDRYSLTYDGNSSTFTSAGYYGRIYGNYIRCVRSTS